MSTRFYDNYSPLKVYNKAVKIKHITLFIMPDALVVWF